MMAGKTTSPASGPNVPPVINSGPCTVCRMRLKDCVPLTGKPKIVPSKKFQPICSPIGSQRLRVRIQANARKYPAARMPRMAPMLAPGFAK